MKKERVSCLPGLPSPKTLTLAPTTFQVTDAHFSHHDVCTHLRGCLRALGSITMNKASGSDGIPVELFQILKDDAVKVLHSICQQIWKTQQWPQDWKRSVFIPISKKGNAKECSNYCTIALISYATKVMLKILQARQASAIREP